MEFEHVLGIVNHLLSLSLGRISASAVPRISLNRILPKISMLLCNSVQKASINTQEKKLIRRRLTTASFQQCCNDV